MSGLKELVESLDGTVLFGGMIVQFSDTAFEQAVKKIYDMGVEAERERLTDAAMKAAEKAVDVATALEREACAKLADKYMERWTADAIRARK
jgi:hypothetical protein